MFRRIAAALALPTLALFGATVSTASAVGIIDGQTAVVTKTYDLSTWGQGGTSSPVVAPGAIYSNVTTFQGSAALPGGFTGTPAAQTYGNMAFDDLNTISGGTVGPLKFSIANLNTTSQGLLSSIRFYTDNGSNAPGTLIGGFNFNAVTVAASSVTVVSFTASGANQFVLPAGKFWAGVAFRGDGTQTSTILNNFGAGLFNPVDVGSSADQDFMAPAAGGPFTAANPSGTNRTAPFTSPLVANYGWEFAAVPEPGTAGVLAIVGLVGMARRRRA